MPEKISSAFLKTAEHAAVAIAYEAGKILEKHFGHVSWGYKKQEGKFFDQVVTRADRESEALIRKFLRAKFHTHNILGEEEGYDDRGSEWTWVLDPLDGTRNFASGFLYWGISIALLHANIPMVGVIHQPPFKRFGRDMFSGYRGGGFRINGKQKKNPLHTQFDSSRIYTWGTPTVRETDLSKTPNNLGHRLLGAAVTDFTELLVGGSLGFILTDVFLHDIAAGAVMLKEAGGELLRYEESAKRWSPHVFRFTAPSRALARERYVIMGGHPTINKVMLRVIHINRVTQQ